MKSADPPDNGGFAAVGELSLKLSWLLGAQAHKEDARPEAQDNCLSDPL
jgi:hypothetical protein